MLALARECGLQVAQSRVQSVGGRDVLLVKRFDREKKKGGYLRHRMVSGLTVLKTKDSHRERERWSYAPVKPKNQANLGQWRSKAERSIIMYKKVFK